MKITEKQLQMLMVILQDSQKDVKGLFSYNLDIRNGLLNSIINQQNNEPIEIDSNKLITVEFLMLLHPQLSKEDAGSLKEFSNRHTVKYRERYGDGSIMYPLWEKECKQSP